MREVIARIIDPAAFAMAFAEGSLAANPGLGMLTPGRQAARNDALEKADQILALEFCADDLPAELQQAVDILADVRGDTADDRSWSGLGPMDAQDGRPVYTGLIKPLADGTLKLFVLLDPDADEETPNAWLGGTFEGAEARRIAAEIEVVATGGGLA